MSSEIYELMKRDDERAVVEKAHANPRFVEDCVREMIRQVAERFPDLDAGAFVMARQENLETIHRHNVVAERYGLISEIDGRARTRRALPASHDDAGVARSTLGLAPRLSPLRAGRPCAAEAEEVVDAADRR